MTNLDLNKKNTGFECLHCKISMVFLGKIPFRLGGMDGMSSVFLSGLADVQEKVANLDVYRCSKCKK